MENNKLDLENTEVWSKIDNCVTIKPDFAIDSKSVADIGGCKIFLTRSFNAFQRKFWKVLLGIDIKNIKKR